jgi:hypothetical protein
VVNGSSPTGSGLQILPLMAGLLITSIGSGQTITRTGIYKPFPIVGTFVMIIGLALLSTMDAGTSRLLSSLFMFILGLGLGMVMQVLELAVQNAVDFSDLGVATSGATLFRSIGGSVGTAILGSIFSGRLKTNLRVNLASNPATSKLSASQLKAIATASSNPKSLKTLPPAVHHVYVSSYANALDRVFVVAAIVAAAAFLMSWLLEQRPLRDTAQASAGLSETFAAPKPADSLAELSRALSVLVGRDGRRRLVEQLAERAGVDLSAAAAWILARMSREPGANVEELCETWDVPLERGRAGLRELVQKGMLVPTSTQSEPAPVPTSTQSEPAPVAGSREVDTAPSSEPGYEITDLGRETAERLVTERRATFARLLDGWEPEENTELAALLTRFAHEMAAQPDLAVTGR